MDILRKELNAPACRHMVVDADLTQEEAWSATIAKAVDSFGRIDVLVHCAGMLIPGNVESLGPETLRRVIDTNFTSVVLGARSVIPVMRRQGSGSIITVGSLGGILPMPYEAVYSATKFAVRGFSLSLYHELRDSGIAVSLISVGPVDTKMLVREAADDHSTISYLLRPLEARRIARTIGRTIELPRIEVILPACAGWGSALLGLFPGALAALQPLLNVLGRRGLRRYRRSLEPARATIGEAHGH
jgi:short-subunit dehydrogenase